MATINLGRVGYVHRGAYDAQTVYQKMDVVFYDHGSYLYIGENASGHAPTDPAYWQAMLDPAEMNAATDAAREAANDIFQRIVSLTSPFTLTGETVRCYPVPDYPLQVITHLAPHRPGKGDPSPANIRALSPVSEVYLNQSDVKEYTQALASSVYGGDYYWGEGRLDVTARYRELDGNEGWFLNQNGDTSYFVWNMQDITAIENKAYMSHYRNRPELAFADPAGTYNVFRYQNHSSGVARLCIRPDLSDYDTTDHDGSVAKWKAYLAAQKAAGTPVQLVYFITAGSEESGYPETVILSHKGENLFYSALHDTTVSVSGPLDPAYQNAQQDERIEALEEGVVSGGGSYTLPVATKETLGGVKVGDGLQVDADGRVSVETLGFELIEEFTLDEDVMSVLRTNYPDGTAYNLKSIIIRVDTSLANVEAEGRGWVRMNSLKSVDEWMNICYGAFVSPTDRYAYFVYRALPDNSVDSYFVSVSHDHKTASIPISYTTAFLPSNIVRFGVKINDFLLFLTSGAIPAGTKITVWGVRADA